MYSKEDSEVIINNLSAYLSVCAMVRTDRRLSKEEKIAAEKEKDKLRIEFAKFEKVILDFQLEIGWRYNII